MCYEIYIFHYRNIYISLQEQHNATRINTINKWDIENTSIYTTGKRTIMASSAERRNKGKAPAQGSSQDKRLPARRSFVMHEGPSSGVKSSRSRSLQEFVPTEVTYSYSSGDMVIVPQEVLSRNLQFHNGTYSELPDSIKFILDNLQATYTKDHQKLFQKTSMNPVNRLFFLIKVLLITLNLVLLTNRFLQNGLQKLKSLFLMIIILLLLL